MRWRAREGAGFWLVWCREALHSDGWFDVGGDWFVGIFVCLLIVQLFSSDKNLISVDRPNSKLLFCHCFFKFSV